MEPTKHPTVSGVIVYVLRNGNNAKEVLFLHRSGGQYKGGWWPVAGTPKVHETPIQTARRELLEETGITSAAWQPFGIDIPHANGVQVLKAFVVDTSSDVSITLNYEHDAYRRNLLCAQA